VKIVLKINQILLCIYGKSTLSSRHIWSINKGLLIKENRVKKSAPCFFLKQRLIEQRGWVSDKMILTVLLPYVDNEEKR
jgi:hypothetical protein